MSNNRGIPLSGNLMYATLAPFGWYGLSSGVFAILTDALFEGLMWLILTIAMAGVLFRAQTVAEQEKREIPIVMWVLVVLVFSAIGVARLFDLTVTNIELLGSIQVPELFRSISSLIYLLLLVVFVWQLFRAYKRPMNEH